MLHNDAKAFLLKIHKFFGPQMEPAAKRRMSQAFKHRVQTLHDLTPDQSIPHLLGELFGLLLRLLFGLLPLSENQQLQQQLHACFHS